MSLGLGHRYWVHVILYFYGSLDDCIKFMNDHKPINDTNWFELRPDVDVKNGICTKYSCSLVEISK